MKPTLRRARSAAFTGLSGAAVGVIVLALVVILVDALLGGWTKLSWEFFTSAPRDGMTEGGIFPAI
jgi:phosphate transport system permease protein